MNNKLTDDTYLIKLKQAGWTDRKIAEKMGISVEAVQLQWQGLVRLATEKEENGQTELIQVGMVMAQQFQLLGQSLGIFTNALNGTYEPAELRKVIAECPPGEDLAAWLLKKTLILKPFSLPSPERLAEEMEKASKAPQN
jgi:transcriptional regulator with XRE-family HTH domain